VQPASKKYKELMRREFRDPLSHIRVTIGLINQQAQASAYVPENLVEGLAYFKDGFISNSAIGKTPSYGYNSSYPYACYSGPIPIKKGKAYSWKAHSDVDDIFRLRLFDSSGAICGYTVTNKELNNFMFTDKVDYIRLMVLDKRKVYDVTFSPDSGYYTYYSSFKMPLDNYEVKELYATCDQDYTAADGNMYFLPRERADVVLNQGIVSEALLGPIEIRFPIEYDIKGLTIEFGKAYPVDFVIESDNNTVEIKDNTDGHFVTEEIFNGATFLRFTPSAMVNGQSRFRIHMITMGIGIYFDNRKILSATKKEHISPIMEELPTIDFSLTVNNKDRAFDIENVESSVNFLEIGQDITVLYGQELDDGSVEWLPGAAVQLKEWSADDEQMEFSATDRFDGMDGTYYKGLYRPEGVSLYDLAVDVFSDAKVDSRTYWIDSYLKSVNVINPMPVVSHKEALQLIANAGRCILYQDRDGNIYLKSSLVPDMKAGSDNETYFSNAGAILDKTAKKAYTMAAKDYTDVKPTQYFLPKKQILRYSANPDGSNMTESRQPNSQYVGVGYMPKEILENPNLISSSVTYQNRNVNGWDWNQGTRYFLSDLGLKIGDTITVMSTVKIPSDAPKGINICARFLHANGGQNDQPHYTQRGTIYPGEEKEIYSVAIVPPLVSTEVPNRVAVRYSRNDGNGTGATFTTQGKCDGIFLGNSVTTWKPSPSDWLADPSNYEWIPIEEYVKPSYLNTGYVSEVVAKSDGSFTINPTVEINLEASFKCFGLTLGFGNNNPAEMIFHAYRDGKLVEDYIVTGLTTTTVIGHEFEEFDRLILEFTKGCPNNRVVLINIIFGDSTDYTFEYGPELTKTPKGTQLPKVRELQVIRTLFSQSIEAKELAKETISITSADNRYTFNFSNPVYDLSCALTEPQNGQVAAIVESSSYYATVEITGVTGAVEVSVSGREYLTSQTKVGRQLNPTGSLETWENPLVSDLIHAADLTDWIGDYMKADREYDLQYRGEPRIDANDIAFLENKYVPDLLLRVYEHTLKFNGALSGTVKARRDMSHVAATKDQLEGT